MSGSQLFVLVPLEDVDEKPGSGSAVETEGSGDSATNFKVDSNKAVILSSSVIRVCCSDVSGRL